MGLGCVWYTLRVTVCVCVWRVSSAPVLCSLSRLAMTVYGVCVHVYEEQPLFGGLGLLVGTAWSWTPAHVTVLLCTHKHTHTHTLTQRVYSLDLFVP